MKKRIGLDCSLASKFSKTLTSLVGRRTKHHRVVHTRGAKWEGRWMFIVLIGYNWWPIKKSYIS